MGKKRSPAKRIERLEGMVLGMGFLLMKIDTSEMGQGMQEQIRQAVLDYKQLAGNIKARECSQTPKSTTSGDDKASVESCDTKTSSTPSAPSKASPTSPPQLSESSGADALTSEQAT